MVSYSRVKSKILSYLLYFKKSPCIFFVFVYILLLLKQTQLVRKYFLQRRSNEYFIFLFVILFYLPAQFLWESFTVDVLVHIYIYIYTHKHKHKNKTLSKVYFSRSWMHLNFSPVHSDVQSLHYEFNATSVWVAWFLLLLLLLSFHSFASKPNDNLLKPTCAYTQKMYSKCNFMLFNFSIWLFCDIYSVFVVVTVSVSFCLFLN